MILTRSLVLRNARATTHLSALAGGSIHAYTGTMPLGGGAVTDQTLLASWTLPTPAGAVGEGAFALTPNQEAMVQADGTPTWVRVLDSSDGWLMDLDAGGVGSGAAVIVTPAQMYAGGTSRIERLRLIEP
ncbi:MAG: hypothetical protein FNT29_10975 [Halothiobacillaceae bacterium]|nr:MAG: hypothetical protein FNT29_10975 [Halothiobacillaceae bacterium]